MRKIIHIDMDAFYASIEQRDRPHLRGRPVAVGGRPEGRGVVAAASYEARRSGVRSAMPSRIAARLCPELIFVPPDPGRYRAVSRKLRRLLDDYSDRIEPLSLDEAYLDVTADKAGLGTAARAAAQIRRRVADELALTCSAGVAPVKFVAKIASDHRKPDGLTVIPPERVLAFVRPLPVSRLWGVGPSTLRQLSRLGVRTIAELADLPQERIEACLGSRGRLLWRMANGDDPRPVCAQRIARSRSAERTFVEDRLELGELLAVAWDQAAHVCSSVRAAGERGRTVTLKLRYADFETVTRAETLSQPTAEAATVVAAVERLLRRTEAGSRPVRLLGVGLSGFERRGAVEQLGLPFAGR